MKLVSGTRRVARVTACASFRWCPIHSSIHFPGCLSCDAHRQWLYSPTELHFRSSPLFYPHILSPYPNPTVVCWPGLLFLFPWAYCGMSVSQLAVRTAIFVLGVIGMVDVGIPVNILLVIEFMWYRLFALIYIYFFFLTCWL